MSQDGKRDATMRVIEEKIRTFTRVEKAFYGSIVLTGLTLAIGIVFLQTRLLQVRSELADLNQKINVKQVKIDDAKQAVNELVRQGRLKEIAEKAELAFHNDNVGVAE